MADSDTRPPLGSSSAEDPELGGSRRRSRRSRSAIDEVAPRRRRSSSSNRRKKRRRRRMVKLLMFFLLLVLGAGAFYLYKNYAPAEEKTPKAGKKKASFIPYYMEGVKYKVAGPLSDKDLQAARTTAIGYLNSVDAEEASAFILGDRDAFIPYYQPLIKSQAKFAFSHGYVYENGARSAVFTLALSNGGAIEIHTFAHPREEFRVDWKSLYLLEGGITLGEIDPTGSLQRVKAYITPNGFYLPEFPKEQYQSLLLQSYSRQLQFPAYVEKDSEVSKDLAKAFQSTQSKLGNRLVLRATLSLQKEGKGYVLKELHSADWTNLESYFSQGF